GHLATREWEEVELDRPTAEQVAGFPAKFARARSAKDEAGGGVFEQPMDLLEEVWHLLDLVDDDDGPGTRHRLFPQGVGMNAQLRCESGVEKVVKPRVRELLMQQGRLAGLAGTPQKDGRRALHGVRSP